MSFPPIGSGGTCSSGFPLPPIGEAGVFDSLERSVQLQARLSVSVMAPPCVYRPKSQMFTAPAVTRPGAGGVSVPVVAPLGAGRTGAEAPVLDSLWTPLLSPRPAD